MSTVEIDYLVDEQIGELFSLQRAAFVDEAMLYGTPDVPALIETRDEFAARHGDSTTLVASDPGRTSRVIGALSLRTDRDVIVSIERLMVAPDRRQEGIASLLVQSAEDHIRAQGGTAVQLIVGELATDNQRLYERLGFVVTQRFPLESHPDVVLLSMHKSLQH